MLAVLNEFERDQIAERTKSALSHKKIIKKPTITRLLVTNAKEISLLRTLENPKL